MSSYNKLERKLGRVLEAFPVLRGIVKALYQRLMYLFNFPSDDVYISNGYLLIDPFDKLHGETFFGYYDKPSVNLRGDILTHAVIKDTCTIYVKKVVGTVIPIAETKAWNWQQGAMTTWVNEETIAFNDIIDGLLVCLVVSVESQTIISKNKFALQAFSPVNNYYVSLDYLKLNKLRPEYGYLNAEINKNNENEGIRIVDIFSGRCLFQLALSEISAFLKVNDLVENSKINHCQFSPNGTLVLFMYRTYRNNGKHSYLLVWDYSRNTLITLMDKRIVSHYSWIDNNQIIVWGRGEFETGYHIVSLNGEFESVRLKDPLLLGDGHPSICSTTKRILTDTYPNKARISSLFLIDGDNEQRLLQLKQPWKFSDSQRVDLHPRFSRDSTLITLESGHSGLRRQYILKKGVDN
jgi:hypothetical protein